MQFNCFKIPAAGDTEMENALNRFLRSHRVVQVERHFTPTDAGGYWSFLVEWLDTADEKGGMNSMTRKVRRDPTEGLSPDHKARYETLRTLRHQIADARHVPAYAIFTNEELVKIASLNVLTREAASKLDGIMPSHLRDNIDIMIKEMDALTRESATNEEGGQLDGADLPF